MAPVTLSLPSWGSALPQSPALPEPIPGLGASSGRSLQEQGWVRPCSRWASRAVPGLAAQGGPRSAPCSGPALSPLSEGSGAAQEPRVTLLCPHGDAPADPTCVSS